MIEWNGPFAETAARSLLHFLWQGSLLGLIAAIGLKLLPPRIRYRFACAMMLLMAVAPVATYLFLQPSGDSLTAGIAMRGAQTGSGGGLADLSQRTWFPIWLTLWLAGVLVSAARAAGGWALAMHRLSPDISPKHRRATDPTIVATAQRLSRRLGIRQVIRVYESASATVPMVFGALKPIILLPLSTIAGLSQAQLEAILAHELAHVARHDFLINCLQCVIEVVLFYHPAVWWISQRIREEREMSCDAIAADLCGDHVLYARALLALEEGRQQIDFALAANGGHLQSRIQRLLGVAPAPRHHRIPQLSVAVIALLLAGAGTAVAVRAQTQQGTTPYRQWVNEDVVYIIAPEERNRFESLMTNEERTQFIKQFWLRRDPTPGTSANEFKEEHYRRIGYSNARFKSPSKSGWATARGRVYIVEGTPDEIESHPREPREEWHYKDGREFEFRGEEYELTRQKSAHVIGDRLRALQPRK